MKLVGEEITVTLMLYRHATPLYRAKILNAAVCERKRMQEEHNVRIAAVDSAIQEMTGLLLNITQLDEEKGK